MKKLIALIGAVATAFGLYADPVEYYANSFETTAEGLSQDGTTWSAAAPWSTTLTDAFNVEAYGQGEPGVYSDVAARRTTMFQAQDTNLNVLKLETGTNTLDLAIGDVTVDPGKFYFDQLVKFTGFEEEPTFAADTKIAVWMSAIEQEGTPAVPAQGEPQIENDQGEMVDNPDYVPPVPPSDDYIAGETNLYVQVGTGTAARKVQIKGSFATETWYRITIKSLGNVIDAATGLQQAGFLVFINGQSAEIVDADKEYYGVPGNILATAKAYYDKGLLFTAIDTTSATLAKVGYQGIGAIDDVILTSTSPDFDMFLTLDIAKFLEDDRVVGAKVIKIGDVTITDQTSIKVKPGDILVSYAANGPFIVRNGENVKWTVNPDSTLVMDEGATIEIVEAAAVLNETEYKAADELYALLVTTGLENGDNLEFLAQVAIKESEQGSPVYEFSEGTTINVTIENNETTWMIESVNGGDLVTDNVGAAAGFAKYYTLADADSSVVLTGEVAGLIQADYLDVSGGVTIIGEGKVVTKSSIEAGSIVGAEGAEIEVVDGADGWKTYQIKQAPTPTETGFMVIIAGQTEGDVYPTLAEAVEAAQDGSTIKLLSDETVDGKCEITKNITLDLNGKTLARDNNAATLFVIKDATLTINGATEGSTLVGRLNVGDSVYNGGVRTAHWDGALVINGGTYSVGDGQTVIHVNGDCLDAAVTINNATLTSPTDNGVQFNGKGTFAINNSTINGATAVYMKAGTLTIDKDSKINATAETWTAPVANHNGSNPTGDAIVMDSITGYQGAISLTVADGATVTKVADGAATIRETITDATDTTTVKIDAPTIGGIALTEAFLEKVANGSAQLPGYVAAIGTVPYQTLAEAVEAAQNGSTIKLLSNEEVDSKCEITKDITLDLNGKTLARDNNAATLFVIKDATLTINGETAGSTLVGRLNVGDSVYNGGVRTDHWEGELVINGGTYSVGNGQTVIHVNGDCLDAAVTINNATLTSPTDNGVQFNGKGTFAINNSTINGATAVYMKAGTLTIDGDSVINATATTWTAPVANHNGSNPTGDAIVMDSITGYQGAISLTVAAGAQVTKVAEGAATIRETITDATVSTTVKIDAPTIGGIALTEAFLAKVADGSAQLPGYVAAIGTVPYQTLAAAVAAAENNDTIVLLDSVAMDNALLVDGKTLTVDLKGFTITPSEKFTDTYIVSIENEANVTLTNGTINLLGKNFQVKTGATATVAANTTVTGTATYMTRVWDGTLNVYGTIYHNGGSGAAVQSLADGGVINVYDGAFVSAGGESNPIRCNFNNGAATINIYGGTLETRGGYTAIYAYKNGNKSVINVYGGLLLAGGSGTEANSIFAITTNDTKNPENNCEVTVTPLDDTCTAKFNNANAKWGLALVDYCKPGYGPVKGDDGYYTIQRVYNVTIAETKNGTVETSVTNNIAAGTEVTITATPADNYELESITTNGTAITGNTFVMPAENVTVAATFKSTAQPGIIPGGDPVPVAGETEADALAEAAKLPITLTADQVSAGLTTADFCNKVRPAAGGGFEAYVEVAAANAPVIETTDVKPIEVGSTDFSAKIENAKPGLFYGFKAVDALGTTAVFAPVGSAATATKAGTLTITAPKGTGNARFYKLTVSITNIWAQ